jgi:Bacterial Ig-like domain (group 3)
MASGIGSARLRAVLVVAALAVTACSGSAGSANDAFNPSGISPTPSATASSALPTPSVPAVDVAGPAVGYPSKTLLAPPPAPVIAGVKVILRANVSVSGRLHATGSVTFTDGPRVLGTAVLLGVHSSGQAELVVALPSGPNVIVAHYLGDTTVAASASTPVAVAVSASATAVTATVKAKAKTPGHVVLAIAVKGAKPGPPGAGYVTVYVDGGSFALRLDAHGHASVGLTLATGYYHSIVVTFPGDTYLTPGRTSLSYRA